MTSIVIASGKGGVGKTSIAVNLALVLAQAGKKTVLVDADIAMASVGIMLGIERAPISLHNVLMGEVDVRDAVYDGPKGLKYVPSGLSLERLKKVEYERLKVAVNELEEKNDFVIIDSPPGLGPDAVSAIKAAKEMLLIVTPEPASLADALKIKNIAEVNNIKIIGMATNFTSRDKTEIKKQDLETLLGLKIIAEIPEDAEARRSAALQQPVALRMPDSPFMHGVMQLAGALHGIQLGAADTKPKRKSVFSGIAEAFGKLFKKKQK